MPCNAVLLSEGGAPVDLVVRKTSLFGAFHAGRLVPTNYHFGWWQFTAIRRLPFPRPTGLFHIPAS